jgi:hypothetical protein
MRDTPENRIDEVAGIMHKAVGKSYGFYRIGRRNR